MVGLTGQGRKRAVGAVLSAVVSLAGCGKEHSETIPPVPVNVATVVVRDVPVASEYVGELVPAQQVTLRARAGGILLEQHVADGAAVAKDDLLFTIDAREAIEQREAARAALAAGRAQLVRAQADVARYQPLLADEAIARQVYDNAVAAAEAAEAAVDAQSALLRRAELAFEYSRVVSPLDGRMGAALVAAGDLISAGSTALAKVAVDDPLWVYINPSESELLAYERRSREHPEILTQLSGSARLLLSDGSQYPLAGRINFSDRALDPATGTYRLRVEFANPEGRLLAGQFARISLQTDVFTDAVVVPARAVLQVLDQAFVGVLSSDQSVEQRPVTLGPRLGTDWIVESGLEAGEIIVVDGMQKLRPGTTVTPVHVDTDDVAGT